jgi:hypothetical protein
VLTEERTMAKPILVGYDTRAADRAPVEFGAAAAAFTGAPLIVAAAYGSAAALGSYGHGLVEHLAGDEAGGALERLERELRERGIDVEVRSLPAPARWSRRRPTRRSAARCGCRWSRPSSTPPRV